MKSITEHPEFEKDGQRNLELFEGTILDAREMFDAGGEAAQTILQKQHDEEMEEFEIWRDKNGFHRNKWGQWDSGKSLFEFPELLNIFRKETAK